MPSSRKPEVSSTGEKLSSLFCCIENHAIVRSMVAAVWWSSLGRMLSPEQEVSIRVLRGLTKHPRVDPSRSISVQKNSMSSCGTVDEMSSIYANKCARLPYPSSPGFPCRSRSAALCSS